MLSRQGILIALVVLAGVLIAFFALDPEDRETTPPVMTSAELEDAPTHLDPTLRDLDFPFGRIPEFAETVRALAAEDEDPSWSEATETRISRVISQASRLGASDIQVDCRSTMCRVQLTDARSSADTAYAELDDLVAVTGLPMLWLWTATDDDSAPVYLTYLQRPVMFPSPLFAE